MQEVSPAWPFIVCTASNASTDMTALQVHYLQRRVRKAADGDDVLLKQSDDEDKLSTLTIEVQKGSEKGRRKALARLWLLA